MEGLKNQWDSCTGAQTNFTNQVGQANVLQKAAPVMQVLEKTLEDLGRMLCVIDSVAYNLGVPEHQLKDDAKCPTQQNLASYARDLSTQVTRAHNLLMGINRHLVGEG